MSGRYREDSETRGAHDPNRISVQPRDLIKPDPKGLPRDARDRVTQSHARADSETLPANEPFRQKSGAQGNQSRPEELPTEPTTPPPKKYKYHIFPTSPPTKHTDPHVKRGPWEDEK
jgi:hypothetical protein